MAAVTSGENHPYTKDKDDPRTSLDNLSNCLLERVSIQCRKTKTKVINLANQKST